MKKNITINLCGRLFQIDEDAYELLQQYINSLRSSFGKQEGGDEIVDDIEARIAELFEELRQQGIEAITIEHVKDIITRIGKPEELTGEEAQKTESKGNNWEEQARSAGQKIYENVRERTAGKKLYRNPKDKMLAGVLSGIAVYTNTDPIIWRLLIVLFTMCYGVGLFIYIVLALVIPEAKTPEGTSILTTFAGEELMYLTSEAKPPASGLLSPEPKRPSMTTISSSRQGGSNSRVTSTNDFTFLSTRRALLAAQSSER